MRTRRDFLAWLSFYMFAVDSALVRISSGSPSSVGASTDSFSETLSFGIGGTSGGVPLPMDELESEKLLKLNSTANDIRIGVPAKVKAMPMIAAR